MKRMMIRLIVGFMVWLPMLWSDSAAQSAAQTVILTGTVSCRVCRKLHPAKGGWTDASCAMKCVREGSDFVLVVGKQMYGNKIYKIDGDTKLLEKLAGGKATLVVHFANGGDTFHVERVGVTRK